MGEESFSSATAYAWPIIRDLDPASFTVVDLRPLRHYRNRVLLEKSIGDDWLDEYREDFIRLIYGYDLLFFVGITKEATFSVVPRPD